MEIDPLPPDPSPVPDSEPVAGENPPSNGRLFVALAVYAILAVLAAFRLDGRPRLVVWIFLGLFAFRTMLLVLKQRAG